VNVEIRRAKRQGRQEFEKWVNGSLTTGNKRGATLLTTHGSVWGEVVGQNREGEGKFLMIGGKEKTQHSYKRPIGGGGKKSSKAGSN